MAPEHKRGVHPTRPFVASPVQAKALYPGAAFLRDSRGLLCGVSDLGEDDARVIRAAAGWLELDLPQEALNELDQLPAERRDHPDVLEARWLILAQAQRWEHAMEISEKLLERAPDRASSWLNHAYATRRASSGGLHAAYDVLAPAADKFPQEPTIPFNLACYTCQLGAGAAATMEWFERALRCGDAKELLRAGLKDPDLKEVWPLLKKRSAQLRRNS